MTGGVLSMYCWETLRDCDGSEGGGGSLCQLVSYQAKSTGEGLRWERPLSPSTALTPSVLQISSHVVCTRGDQTINWLILTWEELLSSTTTKQKQWIGYFIWKQGMPPKISFHHKEPSSINPWLVSAYLRVYFCTVSPTDNDLTLNGSWVLWSIVL